MNSEATMQVFKMNDSLAVELPKAVVDELGLKEGDELSVIPTATDGVTVQKVDARAEFLRQMEQFRFPLPKGYKFDRDETNER
jgi:antitoxin MazE